MKYEELEGKSALVTGASRGIGEATARELAANDVAVVLAARSLPDIERIADEICGGGGRAMAVQCDVSSWADVESAVQRCVEAFGKIDILVNNAGLIEPIARIEDSDPAEWAYVVDVNFKGVYYGIRAALPRMKAMGAGTIINISSGAATSALEGWGHYCSTKAGVLSLTRCTDREMREDGIIVIGLSPGTVATDMQVSIKASGVNAVSKLDPSAHIPANWPAKAVAYLCTEDAKEFAGTDFSLKSDEGRKRAGLTG